MPASDETIQIRDKELRDALLRRATESGARGYTEVARRIITLGLALDTLMHPGQQTDMADAAADAIASLMPIFRQLSKHATFGYTFSAGGAMPVMQAQAPQQPTQAQAQAATKPADPDDVPLAGNLADFEDM